MAIISQQRIQQFLAAGDNAQTTTEKGRALEDLICYIFGKVPGITVTKRNTLNQFLSEEIDVAFWNRRHRNGLYFLQNIILVECKNWSHPLGSQEVGWFDSKLRRRAQPFGILVAANGITGNADDKTAAHDVISAALAEGRQFVVITRQELENLILSSHLVELIQNKLCELAVSGTLFM
jgi:Restriction endonuclease